MSDSLVSLLSELVAFDTTSSRSNGVIIGALEARLRAHGFACERVSYRDDAGIEKHNLLATLGTGAPQLALVGHTDCVPFDAAWSEALTLTERDGKLYGRGSCDTKAFVACAVETAIKTRAKIRKPLLLCFTADEEVGCVGAKRLADLRKGASVRAIIGEPTSLRPIRANKGYCLAEIEIFGKEGHSAYPDSGASAIFRAGRFLTRLESYAQHELKTQVDAKFSPPYSTLNVGVIAGGKAKNIIAGHCRLTLEWRPIPGQAVETVLRAAEKIRDVCIAEDPTFRAEIRPLRMDQGFDTRAAADVVRFLEDATGKKSETVAFGTEGPQMAALGSEPVVFGPGDIQVAHQTGEFVPKNELLACAEILERAVLNFCG